MEPGRGPGMGNCIYDQRKQVKQRLPSDIDLVADQQKYPIQYSVQAPGRRAHELLHQ